MQHFIIHLYYSVVLTQQSSTPMWQGWFGLWNHTCWIGSYFSQIPDTYMSSLLMIWEFLLSFWGLCDKHFSFIRWNWSELSVHISIGQTDYIYLKLVSGMFYQIFQQMIALQKLWKMIFISSKKLFSFSRYPNFCIFVFPSFFPYQPLLYRLIQGKS